MSPIQWRRAAAAILFASVAALAGSPAQAGEAGDEEVLRMAIPFTIDQLDPAQGFSGGFYGASENLVRTNLDGELELILLESLEQVSPTTWVLTLKPGIAFQNGKPVDAEPVAAALGRQLVEDQGAADAIPGGTVDATGELEVTITTKKPVPLLPYALTAVSSFPIYDVEAVEGATDTGPGIAGLGAFTSPYAIVRLSDTGITMQRYIGYWQGPPPLYSGRAQFQPVALALQDQLGALGIGVQITERPYDVDMFDDLSRWDAAFLFDFSVSGSGVPDTGLPTYLHTGGFANYGQIGDPELDTLLDDLTVVGDDQGERDDLLRRIQELVVAEQAYVIHIAYERDGAVVGPGWESYRPSSGSYTGSQITFQTQPG